MQKASACFPVLATYHLGTRLSLDRNWALLPVLLLAVTGDFVFYMSSGLEEVLFTALVTWCVAQSISDQPESVMRSYRFPASMSLLILTRPEGALICALILLWIAISNRSLLPVIRCGFVLMLIVAPVLIAKWIYYGYWLPNTYFVKSHAGFANWTKGLAYVQNARDRYELLLLFFVFAMGIVVLLRRFNILMRILPLFIVIAVWVIYVLLQGGDNMVGRRVLVPVFPLLYAGLVCLMTVVRFRIAAACSVALCIFLVHMYLSDKLVMNHIEGWRKEYAVRKKIGEYLRVHFPSGTLVALNAAGIIPYYSQLPTIDMLGLNDAYIAHHGKRDRRLDYAHQAGDGAYVLSRKPDVILFGGTLSKFPSKKLISDQEIWGSPEFHRNYVVQLWPDIGNAYVRNERR